MKQNNLGVLNLIALLMLIGVILFGIYFFNNKFGDNKNIVAQDSSTKLALVGYRGQVEYLEGEVEKKTDIKSGWQLLEKGDFVDKGDQVRTLNKSRAVITFEDGSILRLDENTSTQIETKQDNIEISLNKGTIFNRVTKSDTRKYLVLSGDLKILALGTEFSVEKETDKEASVMVLESAVEIQDKNGKKLQQIKTGQKAKISGNKVETKTILTADKKKKFLSWNIDENKKVEAEEKIEKAKGETDKEAYLIETKQEKVKEIQKPVQATETQKVSLWGVKTSGGAKLTWALRGIDAPKGFKVVKSTEKNPVYPGNSYKYFSDSSKREYEWNIKDGKGYYFRVCVYLGNGKCGLYSRNVYVKTSSDNNNSGAGGVKSITLSGNSSNGAASLKWNVSGTSSKGFKLVRSTSKNPVYPGDSYKYFSDKNKDNYKWSGGFEAGQKYYFRVCEYLGGKCGVYSNNVSFIVTDNNNESGDVKSITLSGNSSNGAASLKWNVSGTSSKGFKLVRSTSKNPVYPGDSYKYFSDKNKDSYKWSGGFEAGQKYYFRVCEYLGGKCGVYSNNISFVVNSDEGNNDPVSLSLSVSNDGEYVNLNWEVESGETPKGFKAVYSTSANPVYPGNTYKYLSSSSARTTKWAQTEFQDGETYHFRVCEYKGGGVCGEYSNNVSITF